MHSYTSRPDKYVIILYITYPNIFLQWNCLFCFKSRQHIYRYPFTYIPSVENRYYGILLFVCRIWLAMSLQHQHRWRYRVQSNMGSNDENIPVKLSWIFPGAPLKVNGAAGNIQGTCNLTALWQWHGWMLINYGPVTPHGVIYFGHHGSR